MSSRSMRSPAPAAAGYDIRGRVETADRSPVAGASVAISSGPAHPDVAAVTDDDGWFDLPAGSPGEYTVTAQKAGYQAQSVRIDTASGWAVTIVLRRGS